MPLELPPFRPHALIRGGHLQTIVGNYLPGPPVCAAKVLHVELPDGDKIALHEDIPLPSAGSKPAPGAPQVDAQPAAHQELLAPSDSDGDVVILVHGLAGCHQSGYMLRCSAKLRSRGLRVFRMDLRGCGAGVALARHPLHAGRSDDAGAVLEYVHALVPAARIHLVGFSMGANIVLKLAGELGSNAPQHLASVMAICPPIDLALCTQSIQRGLNRLYDRRFANALVGHISERNVLVPGAFTRPLTPRPFRLMDFDRLFTAPLGGFADVHDYYARASSGPVLGRIAVPTLILTAASDPIVPVTAFEKASYSPTTQLHITACGGHLGFVAAAGADPDRRWIDWRVVDWVFSQTQRATATSSLQYPEWGHDRQLCPCH